MLRKPLTSISIHLMLLLNLDIRPLRPEQNNYFNTSYVVIKPFAMPTIPSNIPYFNTSYVVIKRLLLYQPYYLILYFNTSYVVIKLFPLTVPIGPLTFQYILCCY